MQQNWFFGQERRAAATEGCPILLADASPDVVVGFRATELIRWEHLDNCFRTPYFFDRI